MTIGKVTFQTTYNIGPFLNCKVGFEAEPSAPYWEEDGALHIETPELILSNLRKLADEWHKKEYPHLYQESNGVPYPTEFRYSEPFMAGTNRNTPTIDLETIRQREELEDIIIAATTLEELAPHKESIWKAGLTNQYMAKVESLLNNKA